MGYWVRKKRYNIINLSFFAIRYNFILSLISLFSALKLFFRAFAMHCVFISKPHIGRSTLQCEIFTFCLVCVHQIRNSVRCFYLPFLNLPDVLILRVMVNLPQLSLGIHGKSLLQSPRISKPISLIKYRSIYIRLHTSNPLLVICNTYCNVNVCK